jgi:hypothetical protein
MAADDRTADLAVGAPLVPAGAVGAILETFASRVASLETAAVELREINAVPDGDFVA